MRPAFPAEQPEPRSWPRSSSVTAAPRRASSRAHAAPTAPPPMIATSGRTSNRISDHVEGGAMRVEQIRVDPDPYEPFRLSQGFRVGDLLHLRAGGNRRARGDRRRRRLRRPGGAGVQQPAAGARGRRLVARAGRQGHDLPHGHGQLPEDRGPEGQVVLAAVPSRHDRRSDVARFASWRSRSKRSLSSAIRLRACRSSRPAPSRSCVSSRS